MKNQKSETYIINNFDELSLLCKKISERLQEKHIILLNGVMASGKTTFVQYLVKELGGAFVSSPTFAIHQAYKIDRGQADHLDLYRLKNEHDLESTGFWDLFEKDSGLILIEWADRLHGQWWPPQWSVMSLRFFEDENTRCVEIT